MENGNRRKITHEDGHVFEVEAVRLPGWAFATTAIVVNDSIKTMAAALVPSARAMSVARATRLKVLRVSHEMLDVGNKHVYAAAVEAAHEAADRLSALTLLSQGLAVEGSRAVTLGDWKEILVFFKQDSTVGCIEQING